MDTWYPTGVDLNGQAHSISAPGGWTISHAEFPDGLPFCLWGPRVEKNTPNLVGRFATLEEAKAKYEETRKC